MQEAFPVRYWHRSRLVTVIAVLIPLVASCATEKTVVKTAISPDSNNEVQIVSVDNAGPGQHSASIVVQFKNVHANEFKEISISNGDGVVSPNVSANWKDNSTLLVSYGHASIGFQAVKIGNVSIVYEEIKVLQKYPKANIKVISVG